MLKVLFSGGVIRDKKLQRGSVYTFAEVNEKDGAANNGNEEAIKALFEKISLLKWLLPSPSETNQTTPRLRVLQFFDEPSSTYW